MVPVPVPVPVDEDNGDANGSSTQLAFLFGGCHGDGTRVAEDEAFVLDLSGAGGDNAGGRGGGDADETAGEDGLDAEEAQVGINHATNLAGSKSDERDTLGLNFCLLAPICGK